MRRILLAILLLLPLAVAQSATPSLGISTPSDIVEVTRESTTEFPITVQFDSDNPFDTIDGRTIRLAQPGSGVPEGWLLSVEPAQHTGVTAGQSVTFTVRVALSAQAEETEVPVQFQALLVSRSQQDNPVTQQIDPEVRSETLSVTLKREDPLSREFVEGAGPWIWVALGALAILVVALVLLLGQGNKATVALRSNVAMADVSPGRSVAIPISVENLTGSDDTVVFHVAPVAEGWAASLPLVELVLDGRRTEELHLVVTAPRDAEPGSTQRVGVSAYSAQNPKKVAELLVDVHVGDTPERKNAGDVTPTDQQ